MYFYWAWRSLWNENYVLAQCKFFANDYDYMETNLISGKTTHRKGTSYPFCSECRSNSTSCGEDGKFWEKK
jgi:hypothetical protein